MKIHGTIAMFFVDVAAEDDASDEELESLEEEMSDLADLLMEELGLDIVSVESDTEFSCKLNLYSGDDE